MRTGCTTTTTTIAAGTIPLVPYVAGTTLLVPHISTVDTYIQRDVGLMGEAPKSPGMSWSEDDIAGDVEWSEVSRYATETE